LRAAVSAARVPRPLRVVVPVTTGTVAHS